MQCDPCAYMHFSGKIMHSSYQIFKWVYFYSFNKYLLSIYYDLCVESTVVNKTNNLLIFMEFNLQWIWKFLRISDQGNPKAMEWSLHFSVGLFWLHWAIDSKHLSKWVKHVFVVHIYLTLWTPRERINEILLIKFKARKFPLITPLWNYRNRRKLLNNMAE